MHTHSGSFSDARCRFRAIARSDGDAVMIMMMLLRGWLVGWCACVFALCLVCCVVITVAATAAAAHVCSVCMCVSAYFTNIYAAAERSRKCKIIQTVLYEVVCVVWWVCLVVRRRCCRRLRWWRRRKRLSLQQTTASSTSRWRRGVQRSCLCVSPLFPFVSHSRHARPFRQRGVIQILNLRIFLCMNAFAMQTHVFFVVTLLAFFFDSL